MNWFHRVWFQRIWRRRLYDDLGEELRLHALKRKPSS